MSSCSFSTDSGGEGAPASLAPSVLMGFNINNADDTLANDSPIMNYAIENAMMI